MFAFNIIHFTFEKGCHHFTLLNGNFYFNKLCYPLPNDKLIKSVPCCVPECIVIQIHVWHFPKTGFYRIFPSLPNQIFFQTVHLNYLQKNGSRYIHPVSLKTWPPGCWQ